jgi:glutamine amidotransferase
MNKVAIIDYGLCNLDSVARVVEECGAEAVITGTTEGLDVATHIILPGVGTFPVAMDYLRNEKIDEALTEQVIGNRIPFLGVCLGMQMMAEKSSEVEDCTGLGWIKGEVKRLEPNEEDKTVPHIGWNEVSLRRESPLFRNIATDKDFYFVHSYHLSAENEAEVVARTPYAAGFVSAVQRDEHIFGVQFHPEKSQKIGFQVIKNFLAM